MFSKHFNFMPRTLVNFVGGGGKTILIYKLMDELLERGPILYTTTTRIHPPDPDKDLVVISSDNLALLKMLVEQSAGPDTERDYKIVATRHFMDPDLLNGVPADFLESIDRSLCAVFLNEADGSARFSLKLPREGEPVPMMNAEYLVPVIGIDCLGKPAEPATLFRCEAMAEKFSVRRGEIMTPEFAARILMHPDGVCRHWKEEVVIIPFINKVDTPELDAEAKTLASLIMHNGNFPVKKVVFGSVRHSRVDSVSE